MLETNQIFKLNTKAYFVIVKRTLSIVYGEKAISSSQFLDIPLKIETKQKLLLSKEALSPTGEFSIRHGLFLCPLKKYIS